jgi:hypothetical protein
MQFRWPEEHLLALDSFEFAAIVSRYWGRTTGSKLDDIRMVDQRTLCVFVSGDAKWQGRMVPLGFRTRRMVRGRENRLRLYSFWGW